jgi:hypothetical protein
MDKTFPTTEERVACWLAAGYGIDMTRVVGVVNAWGTTTNDALWYELGSRVLYPNA